MPLNLFVWISIWFLTLGAFYVFFVRRGINYTDGFLLTSFYFLATSGGVFLLFRNYFFDFIEQINQASLVVLGGFFVVNVLIHWLVNRFKQIPLAVKKLTSDNHSLTFLEMDYRQILSRSVEIFFQQTMILLLVSWLLGQGLTGGHLIAAFALIFTFAHIPILLFFGFAFGEYFIGASVLAGLVFPALIYYLNAGFVYAYIVHWAFYLFTGIFFRLYFQGNKTTKRLRTFS